MQVSFLRNNTLTRWMRAATPFDAKRINTDRKFNLFQLFGAKW